ncbi:positive regulator of sigma(E), RseC/MucC [Alkalithermobacter thermoalcaliphilus JW-YL-7 = DSM 7308]|uniref:Positive regulator of sigma E, RseC/MucC n=1 Tax=Alkalithermobacter thermoalcaliphilus JW-YL-7 = DSM 7308 TaxID=1121328 RepID=A0A150FQW5_CLOPD|nr:positive regulator of sigma E, RseC/MucC [[Clostridium] paradoxum JW-YL-7 = DSM 7308]SHK51600.1 positive regulator of sigma(E), RseC/MucC [[Clostridium] paradoxum JW-YL-7 = DSM 7308]
MKSLGIVINKEADIAYLKMQRHSACGSCGACKMGDEKSDIEIKAYNKIGAEIGDFVEVDMHVPNFMKAVFIVYTLPLISLLVGVVLGTKVLGQLGYNNTETISLFIGIVLMSLTFLMIRINEKKIRQSGKYIPVITNIIKSSI